MKSVVTARSALPASPEAAAELVAGLDGADPRAIVFFAGIDHDGRAIGEALSKRFPEAHVVGCSTNGEFSDGGYGKGGAVAIALGADKVARCASVLAPLADGPEKAVEGAARAFEQAMGEPLRGLDPKRYVGLALLEGAKGREERINDLLGNQAPQLSFVGGSAADNIQFQRTWVAHAFEGRCELADDACAFLLLDMKAPFAILKTSDAVPSGVEVQVTKADPEKRLLHELDGEPAVKFFARHVGVEADKLGFPEFLANPFGLVLDGDPWLRSVVRPEGESLFLACSVVEGMTLHLMKATDLVPTTEKALEKVRGELGGKIEGAVFWNCAYRMIEAQVHGVEAQYHEALSKFPHAGAHSNGECWMTHLNQTLTGLVIG